MPSSKQAPTVVSEDDQPNLDAGVGDCPFDPSNLAHMRATRPDDD